MENQEPLPTYAVRVLVVARRAIDAAFVHVAETSDKDGDAATAYAQQFRQNLYAAFGGLASFPLRYPVAFEADYFAAPPVRAFPFRYGSVVWRVLYRVREADENDGPRVEIVTVLHGAQKPMTRKEAGDIDAANR